MKNLAKKFVLTLLALSMLASMAACGQQNAETTTEAPAPETTEAAQVPETTAGTDAEAKTILVTNGELPLPEKFDNFVVLNGTLLDHLIALGVRPAASTMPTPPEDPDSAEGVAYWREGFGRLYGNGEVEGVERLLIPMSQQFDANLEKIIGMAPDFIIGTDSDEKYLEKLEAVAPTYLIPENPLNEETGFKDWRSTHRKLGELVGQSEKAEENIAAYDALLASYKEQIGDMVAGKTALVYQISSSGKGLWMASKPSAPQVYEDFGFVQPENFTPVSDYYAVEELVTLNPDYMFINIGSTEEYEKIKDTPIWQNLTAVKEGHVFEFSHYVWNMVSGYMSNTAKLKDVGEFLLNGTQTGFHLSAEAAN